VHLTLLVDVVVLALGPIALIRAQRIGQASIERAGARLPCAHEAIIRPDVITG
jgi:hypothetical protein